MPRGLRALLVALLFVPVAAAVVPDVQNDAGMGRDAPSAPDASFVVATNVVHEGVSAVLADDRDVYGFAGAIGDRIEVRARGTLGCPRVIDPLLVDRGTQGCVYGEAANLASPAYVLDMAGTWFVAFPNLAAGPYRFIIASNEPATDLGHTRAVTVDPQPPRAGTDPTCGRGTPVTETYGEGPSGLVFAALKTGTRAVITWTTPEPTVAYLEYSIDGGQWAIGGSDSTARTSHVFVLDGLPRNQTLCFTPQGLPPQALSLRNAMFAHDGDAYVLNLLVLANEQPTTSQLAAGLDSFAIGLNDATDGHVKAGRIIVLLGDLEAHNSGWTTCYVPMVFVSLAMGDPGIPSCHRAADVIFTADAAPQGAASTYKDAIWNPLASIWMNSYWQAGTVNLGDDVGMVLTHEMGHYAFGAMDLYGDVAGTDGTDCFDAATGISVMGGDRAASEFDDEVNRCPNEEVIAGYVPTWTLLRERFPLVPDRAGSIAVGPTDAGDAYARTDVIVLPQSGGMDAQAPHDDAGSGRDAGGSPEGAVPVVPGVVYDAMGLGPFPDLLDHYSFEAAAGQRLKLFADGNLGCYTVYTSGGVEVESACRYSWAPLFNSGVDVVLPTDGTYVVEMANLVVAPYRFAFTLDGDMPTFLPA